jgi:nicotinamide riboside transporter PnuC
MNLLHEGANVLAHLPQFAATLKWSTVAQAIVVVCGLGGNVLINRKDPRGFYLWIVTNALLVVLQVMTGMYLLIALYLAYSALAVEGLMKWRKDAQT